MIALPTTPADRDAAVAEYVLGTLDARSARMIELLLATDADLAARVAAWEAIFAPLLALAPPEAPPGDLWSRIEQVLAPSAPQATRVRPRGLRLWQGWAIGASLVAAALAVVAVLPAQSDQRMMTVLVSSPNQTAWTAEVDGKGGLVLAALPAAGGGVNSTAPDGNRVLQLWALPPGASAPTSLGLVPRGSERVSIPVPAIHPVAGMLIEISLEPPGGAPGALPTGPVLFIGRLSAAGPRS